MGFLGMFDPFWHIILLFCCLWMFIHVAMTVWCDLWLIRKVRLVENAVVWRKTVAGSSWREYAEPGSDRPYLPRPDRESSPFVSHHHDPLERASHVLLQKQRDRWPRNHEPRSEPYADDHDPSWRSLSRIDLEGSARSETEGDHELVTVNRTRVVRPEPLEGGARSEPEGRPRPEAKWSEERKTDPDGDDDQNPRCKGSPNGS